VREQKKKTMWNVFSRPRSYSRDLISKFKIFKTIFRPDARELSELRS